MSEKIESVMRAHLNLGFVSRCPEALKLIPKDDTKDSDPFDFVVLYISPPSREKSKLLDGRLVRVTVEVLEEP